MLLLTNHIGYEQTGTKRAILQSRQARLSSYSAQLICAKNHLTVATLPITKAEKVAKWHQGYFYGIDFSDFNQEGLFYLRVEHTRSHPFQIGQDVLMQTTFSDLLHYFKSQRCSGIFDAQDVAAPIYGQQRTVDVHGGWYDASGDVSKYLSHLSYANYFNPQQTPMIVWNLLKGHQMLCNEGDLPRFLQLRLTEEALFGADFLYRMQDPQGYFYTTVFDQWSKQTEQREICAYETQQGHKSADYQAAFRQGGGMAIAALAAAARLTSHGQYSQDQYLAAAERGYWHLKTHNHSYTDDGVDNIIDEYCALLASVELYRTTKQTRYLDEARDWALQLSARQHSDDQMHYFWSANHDGSRPYFHASDAGLPVIALCEYLSIESDSARYNIIQTVVNQACEFELAITKKKANPFGYPRQYVKGMNENKRDAFFIAHDNETGYWWQGENARLASLAAMSLLAQPFVNKEASQPLLAFGQNALNWIVGLNPFDICMLDGHGHNNPNYLPELGFSNAKGGVCNGITGGFDDEDDIAFNPAPHHRDMLQNWRWGEQWIPHAGWLLLAVMSQSHHLNQRTSSQQKTTNDAINQAASSAHDSLNQPVQGAVL
ncbi:chitobiase [Vibrio sp. SM6]|uniref:Chitobiase n=1 Tax=Vibrio agarilyticus TaxID=2726741 RepID=A0A7X8TQE1_9VIBR|nr:chitobiase [Vibrio agarilyticus]